MRNVQSRIGSLLLAATLILSASLMSACVSTAPLDMSKINMNDVTLDTAAMGETLVGKLSFDGTLVKIDNEIADGLLGVGGLYNEMTAYMSSAVLAEAIVILRCESASDAEVAHARLITYRDEMADVYAGYNMTESEKLTNAFLACHGRYVFFCVSPDTDTAERAFQTYVVDSLKK